MTASLPEPETFWALHERVGRMVAIDASGASAGRPPVGQGDGWMLLEFERGPIRVSVKK